MSQEFAQYNVLARDSCSRPGEIDTTYSLTGTGPGPCTSIGRGIQDIPELLDLVRDFTIDGYRPLITSDVRVHDPGKQPFDKTISIGPVSSGFSTPRELDRGEIAEVLTGLLDRYPTRDGE